VHKTVRRSARRRARIALTIGLCLGALGSGIGEAAPNETTKCSTTVCATAGVTTEIVCERPDTRTVSCQGIVSVWGIGRANTASLPGTLSFRGDGRCGGSCSSNQLAQGAAPWNGLTTRHAEVRKVLYFPPARVSSSTRGCLLYTLYGASVATARGLAPLSVELDSIESAREMYVEVYACNQV